MLNRFAQLLVMFVVVFGTVGCAAEKRPAPPAKDYFPIMPWELPPRTASFGDAKHGLKSLADCGFTVAGFVRPEHLAECEHLGLKAIISRPGAAMQWEKMSDDAIEKSVAGLVKDGGKSPCVIGYFINDEPGVQKYPALAKAAAAVRKQSPGKIPYINLLPDYATLGAPNLSQLGTDSYDDYLDRFATEVKPDFISYDNYRVLFSNDLQDAKVAASYYNNLLSVRRAAMKHDLPFWVINSSNRIRPFTPVPSPANLLFQAYVPLAAGAKGLTWFTYYNGRYAYAPVDPNGNLTATWSYLKMVNDQVKVVGPMLLKLRSTGVYFTSPAPVKDLPALPGKLIGEIDSKSPIMVGEFDGPDGSKWVMLVNLSLRDSAKPKITWASGQAEKVRFVSPADGSMSDLDPDNTIWLTAGAGVLMKVR